MKRSLRIAACICSLALLAALSLHLYNGRDVLRECPASPKTGRWYKATPDGAVNSDGSQWYGQFRRGSANKVLVYLLGGGVSLDEYSAARSDLTSGSDGFFYARDDGLSTKRVQNGIGSLADNNPFQDWNMVLFPFTTADFHAGSGTAPYTALNGSPAHIHHNGYDNCIALLQKLQPLLGSPEALLIAGYSAGGFGAAMLADDIISFFPDTENVTVCVDGALLIHEDWHSVAENRWHAPQHILSRTVSENLTLDHLCALHEKYGDRVKILFTASLRDGGLARYQSYIDGNPYEVCEAYGDIMQAHLYGTVQQLQRRIPGAGYYIWSDISYREGSSLTRHTILSSNAVFAPRGNGPGIAQWMADATEGSIASYGLDLLV